MSQTNFPNRRFVFFGTPEFAVPSLASLVGEGAKIVCVVTNPDKPAGRGGNIRRSPVAEFADVHRLPLLQTDSLLEEEAHAKLSSFSPDIFIVAAYGKIIPRSILDIAHLGAINVHPSLLPKYRGASPIQSAILNGDSETGVTIMLMDEQMDHGPILSQRAVGIPDKATAPQMHEILAREGAELLVKTLPDWLDGRVPPVPQDHAQATFSKILRRDDGRLDWHNSAGYLERQIRAFQGWPESFTLWHRGQNTLRLKIEEANAITSTEPERKPGTVWSSPEHALLVGTSGGNLAITRLRLEGRREMDAREFIAGHRDIIGSVLE